MNASAAPPPLIYTVDELAALFGVSVDRMRSLRPKLEEAGFPRRLPNAGARWSRPAVDHWISTNGATYAPLMTAETPELSAIDAARMDLEARYSGAAA